MLCGAAAVSVVSKDKTAAAASVVRREGLSEVHVDSAGNQIKAVKETPSMWKSRMQPKLKAVTECNRQFVQRDEGVDDCHYEAAVEAINPTTEILDRGLCDFAAERLHAANPEIEKASEGYTLDTHTRLFLPFPKGCFLNTQDKATSNLTMNRVYFNPTASNISGTMTGKKICWRRKFVNGTKDQAGADGCTGGTVPVDTYNDCWAASVCVAGTLADKLEDFKNNRSVCDTPATDPSPCTSMTEDNRPPGCYITNDLGEWGYNQNTAPDGTLSGTPICLSPPAAATF